MEIFTASEFERLHAQIYDIVERTIAYHPNHNFTQTWNALKKPSNKYPLTKTMAWRTAKLCFNINDLPEYREFILRCLDIEKAMTLRDNHKLRNALDFGEIEEVKQPVEIPMAQDERSQGTNLSDQKSFQTIICTERSEDIQELLSLIIPIFDKYQDENPTDPYSHLIQEWFDSKLKEASNMQELCESTNTTDLEDAYVLMMMAKPLKPYLLFQWENGYITYTIISSINNQEQTYIWINNDEDLIELHRQVSPILEHWITEISDKKHSHIKRVLQTAINKGLLQAATWQDIQNKLQITTYQEYYFYIYKCPQITLQLDLQWHQETQKMSYMPHMNLTEASSDKHQDTPKIITAPPTPSNIPTELHIPQPSVK
jgi:hypothetical protein